MKIQLFTLLLIAAAISGCGVSERTVTGTYQLRVPSKTKLVLKKDKTFEFVKNFSEPGPKFFPDSTEMNFRTRGKWLLNEQGQLVLNSDAANTGAHLLVKDSVIHNTSLTSLSFRDSYGDPVTIRFIKFLPDKIKFYRGNTISFFKEDFTKTDTLEFHFYGYAPVKWPSVTAQNFSDNHSRTFILYEEDREGFFNNVVLSAEKNKLVSKDKSFALYKND
ncbi:MAG TPA: hypothetical protein VHM26_10835 [Chitinophagaceae bacterium]|jgi:hypothetical protein|nr:hypothetical protein [Chitinophagaceae bacterium]